MNFFSKIFMVLVATPLVVFNTLFAPFRYKGEKKKTIPSV